MGMLPLNRSLSGGRRTASHLLLAASFLALDEIGDWETDDEGVVCRLLFDCELVVVYEAGVPALGGFLVTFGKFDEELLQNKMFLLWAFSVELQNYDGGVSKQSLFTPNKKMPYNKLIILFYTDFMWKYNLMPFLLKRHQVQFNYSVNSEVGLKDYTLCKNVTRHPSNIF